MFTKEQAFYKRELMRGHGVCTPEQAKQIMSVSDEEYYWLCLYGYVMIWRDHDNNQFVAHPAEGKI